MEEKNNNINIDKSLKIIVSIAILTIVIAFGMYFFNFHGSLSNQHEKWGTFGDFIGGTLNPILSFFALIALLKTIELQFQQLKISQDELKLSRNELAKSAKALTEQSKNIQKQNFENTFFNLLSLHNNIVNNLKTSSPNVISTIQRRESVYDEYQGKEVFKKIINEINFEQDIIIQYIKIYEQYQTIIGHYFRNIYQILKLIDKSDIENKKFYTNILRAQLSNDELLLIFLNGVTYGKEKTKPLMERYEFLEPLNVPSKYLGNFQDIASQYNKKIFGQSKSLLYDD